MRNMAAWASCLLIAGCASAPPMPPKPIAGVICPPAGTVVAMALGGIIGRSGKPIYDYSKIYEGTPPDDPSVCLYRNTSLRHPSSPEQVRSLAGLYINLTRTEPTIREGLRPLFPLAIGKSVVFDVEPEPKAKAAGVSPTRNTYTVVSDTEVTFSDQTRSVWVLRHRSEDLNPRGMRYEVELIVDKATGALATSASIGTSIPSPATRQILQRFKIEMPGEDRVMN